MTEQLIDNVHTPFLGRRGLMAAAALGAGAIGFAGAPAQAATTPPSPLTVEELARLKRLARKAQTLAYAPYSGYQVGGSLLTTDQVFYRGNGNVENSNYTLTKHGEETAVLAALHDGSIPRAGTKFVKAVYLTTAKFQGARYECLPCGGCRQFVAEFAAPDGQWVIEQVDGTVKYYPFEQFLPFPYTPTE